MALGAAGATYAEEPGPRVVIEAVVEDDHRTIRGTMRLRGLGAGALVDPLAALPDPKDDLNLFRTYPGAKNRGSVSWRAEPDGTIAFTTRLPRRFGALGGFRHRGTFANGGWYPTPVLDGALPELDWQVNVQLPRGDHGALGDRVGDGTLAWSGVAERVPLASVPNGRVTALDPYVTPNGRSVTLLTRGKPRRTLVRELTAQVGSSDTPGLRPQLVIVEAPQRRRLVRSGPGLAFVSDRAYRLSFGLQRFHRVAVARGLLAARAPTSDTQSRELIAAVLADHYAEGLRGPSAARALRLIAWMPSIDSLLYSRRIAFYGDIFEERFQADRVADDLAEMLAPTVAGAALARQLDAAYGPQTAAYITRLLLDEGESLRGATRRAAVPDAWLDSFRQPYPAQDYRLEVDASAKQVRVTRDAPADAPQETLLLRIDDTDTPLMLAPGASQTFTLDDAPSKVTLDPSGLVRQTSRAGDLWPVTRATTTWSWGVTNINLTRFRVEGVANATWRRRYDTRNRLFGSLFTSRATDVGMSLAGSHAWGPLVDGFNRERRVIPSIAVGLQNPRFVDISEGRVSVSGGLTVSNDNRVSLDFPIQGLATSASVRVGGVPGSGRAWTVGGAGIAGALPLHPRHTITAGASATLAYSTRPDAWPSPAGAMLSFPVIPPCGLTESDATDCITPARGWVRAAVTYRAAPIRGASVPMLLGWGTEIQTEIGAEVMQAVLTNGQSARAIGLIVGLHGVGDVVGAEPRRIGVRAGWALYVDGFGGVRARPPFPELVLAW